MAVGLLGRRKTGILPSRNTASPSHVASASENCFKSRNRSRDCKTALGGWLGPLNLHPWFLFGYVVKLNLFGFPSILLLIIVFYRTAPKLYVIRLLWVPPCPWCLLQQLCQPCIWRIRATTWTLAFSILSSPLLSRSAFQRFQLSDPSLQKTGSLELSVMHVHSHQHFAYYLGGQRHLSSPALHDQLSGFQPRHSLSPLVYLFPEAFRLPFLPW